MRSLTRATIRPPWAISAPNSDFTSSAFAASMAALVSCRRASMSALTAGVSALVPRLALRRATCSSARVSACFSGEAALGKAFDEAMSVESDGLGHGSVPPTPTPPGELAPVHGPHASHPVLHRAPLHLLQRPCSLPVGRVAPRCLSCLVLFLPVASGALGVFSQLWRAPRSESGTFKFSDLLGNVIDRIVGTDLDCSKTVFRTRTYWHFGPMACRDDYNLTFPVSTLYGGFCHLFRTYAGKLFVADIRRLLVSGQTALTGEDICIECSHMDLLIGSVVSDLCPMKLMLNLRMGVRPEIHTQIRPTTTYLTETNRNPAFRPWWLPHVRQ